MTDPKVFMEAMMSEMKRVMRLELEQVNATTMMQHFWAKFWALLADFADIRSLCGETMWNE
ncbi:hypothetical protein TIFTF001_017420 [Ficus carica]|uniref:Uncharacterized protein n=1 Tax=Ficus carica TaxID=3494 RepID=A0AA88AC68_FICCA|nr:hypothetical protein TIFTF001_017420 [Ficus carica]